MKSIIVRFTDEEFGIAHVKATISDVVSIEEEVDGDTSCVVLLFDEVLELAEKVKEQQERFEMEFLKGIEKERLEKWNKSCKKENYNV